MAAALDAVEEDLVGARGGGTRGEVSRGLAATPRMVDVGLVARS